MTDARAYSNPDRIVRLLVKNSRGYQIVLQLPAHQIDACAEWALDARRFDAAAVFKFEETSGQMIKDRLLYGAFAPPTVTVVRPVDAPPLPRPPAPSPAPPPAIASQPAKPPSIIAGLWALLRGR